MGLLFFRTQLWLTDRLLWSFCCSVTLQMLFLLQKTKRRLSFQRVVRLALFFLFIYDVGLFTTSLIWSSHAVFCPSSLLSPSSFRRTAQKDLDSVRMLCACAYKNQLNYVLVDLWLLFTAHAQKQSLSFQIQLKLIFRFFLFLGYCWGQIQSFPCISVMRQSHSFTQGQLRSTQWCCLFILKIYLFALHHHLSLATLFTNRSSGMQHIFLKTIVFWRRIMSICFFSVHTFSDAFVCLSLLPTYSWHVSVALRFVSQ